MSPGAEWSLASECEGDMPVMASMASHVTKLRRANEGLYSLRVLRHWNEARVKKKKICDSQPSLIGL